MLIRMTGVGSTFAAFLMGAAVAIGGLVAGDSQERSTTPRMALVIDAGAGRDGRELLDARLRDVDAEVRLPRTATEARTNVRYFAAQGYRVVVTGPRASAAARAAGVPVVRAPNLKAALAAVRG